MSDFSDPTLREGETHAGFEVTAIEPLPELAGTAYVMRHVASGARTLWIACDDANKSFAIAFKTPPANDTGVFHILEHSVLCGSDRFPVKEPFVNLLKTSMQTFLNALTFSDKTMYPVASTSTADLENLMDVYLDAVLHPAIYQRPRIFEQEGWHLETNDDGSLAYNGVVFNEMKGATSDPDDVLMLGVDRALFPDTCYRFESGGDPRAIPTLSYEEFLNAHARHYDLANSYVILYGNMDIERELAFIDKRLQGAERRNAGMPNPLEMQHPVVAGLSRVEMATAPENAAVALAYVVGDASQRERLLATDVLLDAIAGSNESPLKRAVLEEGLGDDFVPILADGELQPRLVLMLKGAKEGVAERFRALVEDTCARLSTEGIGHDRLAASLAQAEFHLREQDFGSYPAGIALSMQAMASWLYDDARPVDFLRFEDILETLKASLDEGYFERLLRDLVCESKHSAEVELVPVQEGAAAQEEEELRNVRESLSDDDLQRIAREVEALRAEQEAPDSPEDLAKLPRLSISDIEPPKPEGQARDVDAPLPCIAHELETRGIDYVFHYFDLRHLSYEDLPYVGLLSDLLGKLATKEHSAADLDTLVQLNLGTLDVFCETFGRSDDRLDARPTLVIGASALATKVDDLARIPAEVWNETLYDDADRILALLQQRRIMLEQHFINAGHASAIARMATYWSAASKVAGQLGGIDYYSFLKDLLGHWEERKDELCDRLCALAKRIFTSSNVISSFVGTADDRERFWKSGGALGLAPLADAHATLVVPVPEPRNEAFVIPSNVSYVAAGIAPAIEQVDQTAAAVAAWRVAQRAFSYDYLWNEVRVKGGAYGSGFRRTQTGILQCWSYRDPGIDATLRRYDDMAAWLRAWQPDEDELTGYIVSTIASHDAPTKPRAVARRQDLLRFSGRSTDWRDLVRAEELAVTADGIRLLADSLDELAQTKAICVFGPRDAIEASSTSFDDVIDLMG
ncbi:MAG: insulinase family protein [Atopobiaceae bacterium]|nr:insulinase family protein [Atopobiaceae bacterium]